MAVINPNLRATRQTIGNLDGGSAGLGGVDGIRIQPGTGNFGTLPESLATTIATSGPGAPPVIVNVGSGVSIVTPGNGGTLNLKTIKAGEGISVQDTNDGIVISATATKTFIGLRDAPTSYSGQDGKVLVVDEANRRLVFSRASNVTVSADSPINPRNGDGWWQSTTGNLYIYYVENDYGQWVESAG